MPSYHVVAAFRALPAFRAVPASAVGAGTTVSYGWNSFQVPSETTWTAPSTTRMAV